MPIKKPANYYYEMFEFLNETFDIVPLDSDMQEIRNIVEKWRDKASDIENSVNNSTENCNCKQCKLKKAQL